MAKFKSKLKVDWELIKKAERTVDGILMRIKKLKEFFKTNAPSAEKYALTFQCLDTAEEAILKLFRADCVLRRPPKSYDEESLGKMRDKSDWKNKKRGFRQTL